MENLPTTQDSQQDLTALYNQISTKIINLENALLSAHPEMPSLLRDIHKSLKDFPGVVTLLTTEQIRSIINGLTVQTSTDLIMVTAKKSSKKALKDVTEDDI